MFEYAEEYASVEDGWTEILNHYADDGWRLHSVVTDDIVASPDRAYTAGAQQFRLIFERRKTEETDG